MDTNIPAEGMHYNSATTMPKPMQSVGPVQAQCSYYGLSVEEVSASRVLGVTGQGGPTFYPDPGFDNYNTKNTIQSRSTSILPGSTLFMSPENSCAELSTDSGSKIGLGFIDESDLSLAFSSESELTELKSVARVDGMSCDLNQGMCLTDQSQSFSMHTDYQWQDLMHAMTPMLETLGQDNVNTISFQRDEVAHSVDPSFGDISKHIGEARKTLDRNIMKCSQEGHDFGCTVPKNVTETEMPGNPFSDNAQEIIKRKSKTVKSKLEVAKSESKIAESETKKTKKEEKQDVVIDDVYDQIGLICSEILSVNAEGLAKKTFLLKKRGGVPSAPRSRNSFMIFSNWMKERFKICGSEKTGFPSQSETCKFYGKVWKKLDDNNKSVFIKAANIERANHKRHFTDYKYKPKRRGGEASMQEYHVPNLRSSDPIKIKLEKRFKQNHSETSDFDRLFNSERKSDLSEASRASLKAFVETMETSTQTDIDDVMSHVNSPLWDRLASLCCKNDGSTPCNKKDLLELAVKKLEFKGSFEK